MHWRGRFAAGCIIAAALLALPAAARADERRAFVVYDNMFFRGKPDTTKAGLVASDILYEGAIWPRGQGEGVLPERGAFEALVRAHAVDPGPFVLDIERLPLRGPPGPARQHLEVLAQLADWARRAVPGKLVGYYGSNTLTRVPPANLAEARELARHVTAFFPPAYTFDDDREAWASRAQAAAAEARALGPGKPVFFYLWPQYHDNTPRQFQFVDGGYWKYQLETARRHADGIVIWGSSKFDWNETSGWWAATREFVRSLRSGR